MIAAAQAIREAGIMEYPIVMNMKTGWNVSESFNLVSLRMEVNSLRPVPLSLLSTVKPVLQL